MIEPYWASPQKESSPFCFSIGFPPSCYNVFVHQQRSEKTSSGQLIQQVDHQLQTPLAFRMWMPGSTSGDQPWQWRIWMIPKKFNRGFGWKNQLQTGNCQVHIGLPEGRFKPPVCLNQTRVVPNKTAPEDQHRLASRSHFTVQNIHIVPT